jgi:hypothetical protein
MVCTLQPRKDSTFIFFTHLHSFVSINRVLQKEAEKAINWGDLAAADCKLEWPQHVRVPSLTTLPRDMIAQRLSNVSCVRLICGAGDRDDPSHTPAQQALTKKFFPAGTTPHQPPVYLGGLALSDLASFNQPLNVIPLAEFVVLRSRTDRGLPPISAEMPFDLSRHPSSRSHSAQSILNRTRDDVTFYAEQQNKEVEPQMIHFLERDIESYVRESALGLGTGVRKAVDQLKKLMTLLNDLHLKDLYSSRVVIDHVMTLLNGMPSNSLAAGAQSGITAPTVGGSTSAPIGGVGFDGTETEKCARLASWLSRLGGQETMMWFEHVVGVMLSDQSETEIRQLNPLLTPGEARRALEMTAKALVHTNRAGHTRRCIAQVRDLLTTLTPMVPPPGGGVPPMNTVAGSSGYGASGVAAASAGGKEKQDQKNADSLQTQIALKAEKLAAALIARRHFSFLDDKTAPKRVAFDPRFLVFEFTYNLVLRHSQVQLVHTIVKSGSTAHQLIMGSGKTTVIAPLLGLLMADGKRLVTQVVPGSLLEFSRQILRERFSAVVRKPVYTFTFGNTTFATPHFISPQNWLTSICLNV